MSRFLGRIAAFLVFSLSLSASAIGGEDPIERMAREAMSFFRPIEGRIAGIEGSKILVESAAKDALRPGMRLNVLREGETFIHPVTKEPFGRMETLSGKVELRDVQAATVIGVLIEGEAREGDKVRISETKVKLVFCQDRKTDWYLADEYYRKLKDTGRIEMIDTSLETDDEGKLLEEARRLGADVAVLLTSQESGKGTLLKQRLFWVSDGSRFLDSEGRIDVAFEKDLKFGDAFFTPHAGEALLRFDLPYGARHVVTGDLDGDGKQEIVLSTGTDARAYVPGVDLQPLWELKGSGMDDHIWMDAVDLNGNGRDELIITSMRDDEVVSAVHELTGTEFRKLWETKHFLRKSGTGVVAQAYSPRDGYTGDIMQVGWEKGEYRLGEKVSLPRGVNVYDYVRSEGSGREMLLLAFDEKGFLHLYNEKGIRVWTSAEGNGGFLTTFKRKSPGPHMDTGEWAVKDRLTPWNREVLSVQRIPVVDMAKGFGYKNSRIRNYWWNGFSMESSVLVDDITGTLLDYAVAGDKMIVLSSPFLGIKFGNILKGENPLGTVLSIYSVKGR